MSITEDMLDPNNPEFTEDNDETITASVQQKFAGIARSIRSLATYNSDPQDEWVNIMVKAAVMVLETTEAAYLATVYDGNPEPKTFREAQMSTDFSNWGEAMCTEFRNMEHKQVWEITPNTSVPIGSNIIGAFWVLAKNDDRRY
jgi:hypothetical protein